MITFELLSDTIEQTHVVLHQAAIRALNSHITLRNWLVGMYLVEYEQKGQDRATYGEKLLSELSKTLTARKVTNMHERELRRYRQFYHVYQRFGRVFQQSLATDTGLLALPFIEHSIRGSLTPELNDGALEVPSEILLKNISFTHFAELIPISDALKRTFYEVECIKGCWGVRELKRQISSLYYERVGLSQNPQKAAELTQAKTEKGHPAEIVKSVYVFEFLGLKAQEIMEEKDLESALLDHLQAFLMELGHGFCLEARQKKILIGDEYYFIDLVFYHRILKCHVLVELKMDDFHHVNAGQLNTYVNYFKYEVMRADDNPPIGLLLVTGKNETLVQYATAGMDNQLFVSKYLLELPNRQVLEAFIQQTLRKL
ncbi:MAG: hypothetical protein RLZZ628_2048 [Bacteroidota bacterium]|jgi:predicted nuclease of restriction endonuclease-like (RecB) superfamily